MAGERYLIDFPSDKVRVGQMLTDATEVEELTYSGEIGDSRAMNLTALFAAYLTRYSNLSETVFRRRAGHGWDVEAFRVNTGLSLSSVEETELPEPAEPGEHGLAMGLCTEAIDTADVLEAKLDFILLVEQGAQTRLRCYFSKQHFDAAGVKFRLHAFSAMLNSALKDPEIAISEMSFSTDFDLEMLAAINNTSMAYDAVTPIHQRFEAQAQKTPDAQAICFDNRCLSYSQLDHRSNQYAHYLRSKGAERGVKVGLLVERSEEMIVAMLGILKSGAAYIPLDPNYPADRVACIVEDSQVPIIVTQKSLSQNLDADRVLPVIIDELEGELRKYATTSVQAGVQAEDFVYLIYTSGSTGKPKGVQVSHRNVSTFVEAMLNTEPLNRVSRSMASIPISFDISVSEIFCPLLNGGCVVVASRATVTNPIAMAALIEKERVETVHATASSWRLLIESGWVNKNVVAITGGEAYPREMVAPMLASCRGLWNLYGPTEATVFATVFQIVNPEAPVTIGKPLPNYTVRICDQNGELLPFGATGELWIGGPGVSHGYTNRDDLNASQFPVVDGDKFYRTGDSARLLIDGSVEYFGRLDDQVKVNGYRIELGEIEAALSEQEKIARGVVGVQSTADGDEMLVAWCLMEEGEAFDSSTVKQSLSDRLPSYMIPIAWKQVDTVPTNANGKVDRKALPAIDFASEASTQVMERSLVLSEQLLYSHDLWMQMLNLENCDENASFFELGGTSMLALQFVNRVNAETGSDHSIVDFFSNPNIQAWKKHVEKSENLKPSSKTEQKKTNDVSLQDIAIVGMAVNVPGASGLEQYWKNIEEGIESISRFSKEELLQNLPAELIDDPAYVAARGVVKDCDAFDHDFFAVNPREASVTDPQQRLFLQTAWHAFEDAGQVASDFDGLVGVYAGTNNNSYHHNNAKAHENLIDAMGAVQEMIACEKDYVATRVAYKLNIKGPAVSVHTACSTSLVAIAQACSALRLGQCDMAVAGAASVTSPVASGHEFQEGGVFCRDGHTKSFSADATGTMFSDGVGAVVLKRVDDAVSNGDRIYAVIKAAAINNDGGGKMSFMAPSSDGQAAVIEAALRESGVSADTIGYVEAHGTATPVGDPIEIEGLRKAFESSTDRRQYCAIGSVKSNVGHLTAAAGVAGLIKAALSLHRKVIPPSLFCKPVNPAIRFEHTPFYPADKREDWVASEHPRRAGVSSFGVGGTNSHAILEEFETPDRESGVAPRSRELLLLSAKTRESLDATTADLSSCFESSGLPVADVSHTLLNGRTHFSERRFVVTDQDKALERLRSPKDMFSGVSTVTSTSGNIAFMFPGQGSQYAGMGCNLYESESVYRDAVDYCAQLLLSELELDIRELLLAKGEELDTAQALINQTRYTQPCLFVTGYALSQLWLSWGVKPAALIGHSIGEFVAAHLSGVFSLEDALMLVARRGALMQALPTGAMLTVRLGEQDLSSMLPENLSIAAVNGKNLCVVAGENDDIQNFAEQCEKSEIVCRALQTSHAFHSQMMDPIVEGFANLVESTKRHKPKIDLVSTANAQWHSSESAMDPNYWAGHLRRAVRFAEGIQILWEKQDYILLELGPRATASTLARQQATDHTRQIAIPSLADSSADDREIDAILSAVGKLWQCDIELNWKSIQGEVSRRIVGLPGYAFSKNRFWLKSEYELSQEQKLKPKTDAMSLTSAVQVNQNTSESVTMSVSIQTRQQHLISLLKQLFEETSGMDLENADVNSNFMCLGLDSLFLTQAGNSIKKKFGVVVSFRQLMESYSCFELLAEYLDKELAAGKFEPELEASPAVVAPVAQSVLESSPQHTAATIDNPAAGLLPNSSLSVESGTVEALVQQQLQIMSQQLQLLGGAPVTKASTSLSQENVSPLHVTSEPTVTDVAVKSRKNVDSTEIKPFGAQARISTDQTGDLSSSQLANLKRFIASYNRRTISSKEFAQEHRGTFSDPRIVNGFTPLLKEAIYPMVVNRSAGSKIWDIDDNEYIDITNCFGANFLGYGVEQIKEALHRQIDLGFEIGPTTPDVGEVAKLACELTGAERFAFCNTGSEAVLGAVRAARSITARDVVVSFNGDYHGLFDEVIVRGSPSLKSFAAASGVPQSAVSQTLVLDYGADEALEQIRDRAEDIAAILVEPVQSRNPGLQPREFLHKLRALTEELDIALIFDEVITGFRIQQGGAQAYFGVRADIASYGKIVGGGMPIGMIGGKAKYMDAFDGGQWQFGDDSAPEVGVTYLAGTFVRHPLAMAASKALLQTIKSAGPELYETINARADSMTEELNAYFKKCNVPYNFANFGSLFKLGYPVGSPNAELLFFFARYRGLHIWDGLPMCITAAHSDADVKRVVEILKLSVDDMLDHGFMGNEQDHAFGEVNQRIRLIDGEEGQVNWVARDDRQSSGFKAAN